MAVAVWGGCAVQGDTKPTGASTSRHAQWHSIHSLRSLARDILSGTRFGMLWPMGWVVRPRARESAGACSFHQAEMAENERGEGDDDNRGAV